MRLEARPADLAAEDRQLVAEHEDLQLLGSIAAAEEHDELEQATDDDVEGGHKQRRPPADGDADATVASAALVPHLIEYLHPTGTVKSSWPRRGLQISPFRISASRCIERPRWSLAPP